MKIGIIGLGNMGKALLKGILKEGSLKPSDILASSGLREEEEAAAREFGIRVTPENKEAAKEADILILAVKPQVMPGVLKELRGSIPKECVVLSIAAGISIAMLEENLNTPHSARPASDGSTEWLEELNREPRIARAMPNTPALVGAGTTAVSFTENVSAEQRDAVKKLLSGCGMVRELPEKLMDAVVAVSGSSPAYVFLFIEALADAAVKEGMPRALAYEFAAGSVMGSAKLMLETGKHPGELKDMVCSPAGTTIEAVRVLEEGGFRGLVMDAASACADRSRELGQE